MPNGGCPQSTVLKISKTGLAMLCLFSWTKAMAPRPPKARRCVASRPHAVSSRLFGSKAITNHPPGEILIEDKQRILRVNVERLRITLSNIRRLIGYETYDVSLFLVVDKEMKATNRETRGIDAPTDILSFPFHPHVEPGVLQEPDFDIRKFDHLRLILNTYPALISQALSIQIHIVLRAADYYNLGDMMVDVPYVIRRCDEDAENEDDETDRGVSGAMACVHDPEKRIAMLLVHGMLHLVGYDHETDADYACMVKKEEEILHKLKLV